MSEDIFFRIFLVVLGGPNMDGIVWFLDQGLGGQWSVVLPVVMYIWVGSYVGSMVVVVVGVHGLESE